ncbi:MAG: NYN domain-containing protein [Bacteroidota bacterium]|jgi:predicted RNA-binding protein with PIN domain|nr:NYN domain-containing protein [Bacteroidota bacterium]
MEYKRTYIDGYNVLHKFSRLTRMMKSNPDAARRGLIEFVRKKTRGKGHVTVVFDGHGDAIGGGTAITVVYSLARTADDWIRFQLERDPFPRMALVVSSDNEVRAHAAICGAHLLSAQEFIDDAKNERADLVEQHLKNRPVSESEVRFWLAEFERARKGETE